VEENDTFVSRVSENPGALLKKAIHKKVNFYNKSRNL
jgi:hypothetical protein